MSTLNYSTITETGFEFRKNIVPNVKRTLGKYGGEVSPIGIGALSFSIFNTLRLILK